jgi:hypothetical protein
MNRRLLEQILWAGATVGLVAMGVVWQASANRDGSALPRNGVLQSATPMIDDIGGERLTPLKTALVESDPFRLDRRPAPVRYRPELEGAGAPAPPPSPPKPVLVLRGIVGGPPWDAMIDGVPGRQGAVLVHRGDTLGGLTVGVIQRDTVIIHGADTTWRLSIRRSW